VEGEGEKVSASGTRAARLQAARERRAAAARERGGGGGSDASHRHERTGFRQFVRECWAELHRVQWPDRRQLWQATAVVIVVCAVLGVYIAVLDSVFAKFASWLIREYAKY
jgi:preprotein translocase SecE subunit